MRRKVGNIGLERGEVGGWVHAGQIILKLIIKRGDGGAIEMWSTYNLKYLEALKQKWHMIPFAGKANGRQNNEGNVSIFTITIPASFSPPPFPTHEQGD